MTRKQTKGMTVQERKEIIKNQIIELNNSQKNNPEPYNVYLKKYKSLDRKFRSIGSVSEQMKTFGSKVTKNASGWYTYHGVNFSVDLTEEQCESKWWELDIWTEGTPEHLNKYFDGNMNWDTKGEAVWAAFCYDKSISESK